MNVDRLTIPDISIHTALAGCDQDDIAQEPEQTRFQSTQPSQAVTQLLQPVSQFQEISIHTALAGCDHAYNAAFEWYCLFQSTQPSQAVTKKWMYETMMD